MIKHIRKVCRSTGMQLNKVERARPLVRGLKARQRITEALKALAWGALALAAAGALVNPLMRVSTVELVDVCALAGMAGLIVRARLQELWGAEPQRVDSDDFQRTQRITIKGPGQ